MAGKRGTNMVERILVIGATGMLGKPVAHVLGDLGLGVRVMSRNASRARADFPDPFEIIDGNARQQGDIEAALSDCQAVHISIDHRREDECVAKVVAAAQAQGLERISYVSGTTVCQENRWFPLVDRKLRSEQAIRASGIDFTIYCPGWFMEMVPRFVRDGRAILFGRPSRRWHFVSTADFARMVGEGYRRPEAVNKRFTIHGPQALTVQEALEAYCRVLHPEIKSIRHLPYWLLRLVARFSGNTEMRLGLDMVSYLEKVGERGDPAEANSILGPPRVTFEQWLRQRQMA